MPHKHKRKRGEEDKSQYVLLVAASWAGPYLRSLMLYCSSTAMDADIDSSFDLPPAARATPLSTHKQKPPSDSQPQRKIEILSLDNNGRGEGRSNKRRKPNKSEAESSGKKSVDDTPKQFARLMAWRNEGKALRKGLDDGERKPKKQAKNTRKESVGEKAVNGNGDATSVFGGRIEDTAHPNGAKTLATKRTSRKLSGETKQDSAPRRENSTNATEDATSKLKILPGERLSDFALRVDQTLPLSSIPKHSTKETVKIPGLKQKQNLTKHNKKLLRKQGQWREEEKRRKEKEEEKAEEWEDQREEDSLLWNDVDGVRYARKGKRKRGKESGEEGDIWKALARKKTEGKALTVQEMAKEPPMLGRVRNMFKEPGAGGQR